MMAAGTPSTDAPRREPRSKRRAPRGPGGISLRELGVGAAWVIGIAALTRIIDAILGTNPLASALVAAVAVELATTRAGVRWDEEVRPNASDADRAAARRRALRRFGLGAGIAAAVVVGTVVALAIAGRATLEAGRPGFGLVLALARSGAVAVRDELALRGLPLLVASRARVPGWAGVAFAALAGAAWIAALPGATPEALALALASGWTYAMLWRLGRGAWAAVSAHGAYALLGGAGLRGGLVDVTFAAGSLSEGPKAAGAPAWLAAIAFAAAAGVLTWRERAGRSR